MKTKKDPVLHFLKEACGKAVSGEEISQKLGVTRAWVWKEIQTLRELGYEIEAQPHSGYKLIQSPDRLFADEISEDLGTQFMGQTIFSYEELDSTNDTVFRMGEEGVAEGATVFSEYQKKGRGRLGRTWEAPKGKNILFSYLLRPALSPSQVSRITLVAGVSVVRACRQLTGRPIGIKWPNDIYFGDKKIGGILTEMSAESDRIKFVVVGVGINANAPESELPAGATSLSQILGHPIPRVLFCQNLLREIEKDMLRFRESNFEDIASEWESYSVTTGQRIVATLLDRRIEGQATGIDAEGALWIRKDNGLQERILSGDVQHVRPLI